MNEPNALRRARALRNLRVLRGWSQGDLAREAGLDRSSIRRLESGDIVLSSERLEWFAALMKAKPGQVEMAIAFAATEEAPEGEVPSGPADPRDQVIEITLANANAEMRQLLERTRWESDLAAAKADAAQHWRVLAPMPHANRVALVEECPDFPTPALCARLCDQSVRAASRSADETVALAKLALRVTELIPGFYEFPRAQGYAYAFAANSHRVANELDEAAWAMGRCRERFPYGLADPTGLFPESRVLDLEASLRRNEGKLGDAKDLLDRALAICAPAEHARILLKQATTFEQGDEPERALAALREALPKIPHTEDGPRFLWLLRCNEVKILLALDQPREAAAALPELRRLGAERGDRLSFLRLRWLEATVTAALGGMADALVELAGIRRSFLSISLPADAAIVGLHEAEILLRQGRNAQVRELVAEMQPIFAGLRLELQALAAVRLFVEAAQRDAATVEMVREAVRALCRVPRQG